MARADDGPGRTRGWVIGRAAGAPVVVSPGWLVAAVVFTVALAPVGRLVAPQSGAVGAYALAAAATLLLFGSTFLHELAHAVVARRRGMTVHQIALTLLGGHTELGGAAGTPSTSALVAVVGPATNLVLAGLAALAWQLLPTGGTLAWLALAAAAANAFVGVLNLLPGLPLDGGRVLEAALWSLTGRRSTGTTAAGWTGRAIAVGVLAWALLPQIGAPGGPDLGRALWGSLIGAFVWSGATQSLRAARSQEALERLSLRTLTVPAVALPAADRVSDLDALGDPCPAVVLLGPDGVPAGYVDPAAARAVPTAHRAATPLGAVAVPLPTGSTVAGDLTGSAAVDAVAQVAARTPVMVVLDDRGEVLGLLRALDVVGALRPGR
ncbi:MAG TPA: site-2 protease family protein [Actinotalea sp.]|nr:site-2 protease family protein [Actinotalea sp.]